MKMKMKNLFQSNIKWIAIGAALIIISATGVAIASQQINKTKPEISTVKSITPSPDPEPSPTPTPSPNPSPKSSSKKSSNVLGETTNSTQLKTYPIIPTGDLSGLSPLERQQMIEIYNEFLTTPNLKYLTPQQQQEVFKQKVSIYLDNYKRQLEREKSQLQENVNQLNQQLNQISPTNTPIPTPIPFVSPEIEATLAQLNQTLTDIENKPVAMNIIEGRRQRAYEDWVSSNQALYAQIVGSRYKNNLNAILTAHGMWFYAVQ